MTTTFEEAQVGDKVWCAMFGWGVVIGTPGGMYPIEVRFETGVHVYTLGGKYRTFASQTLFWDEIEITAPPMPERVRYKNVNGFKVPTLEYDPDVKADYYYPAPQCEESYLSTKFSYHDENDLFRYKQKMCYPFTEAGRQAAIAHAKAWLGEGELWTNN